jgi:hypothetical protein
MTLFMMMMFGWFVVSGGNENARRDHLTGRALG